MLYLEQPSYRIYGTSLHVYMQLAYVVSPFRIPLWVMECVICLLPELLKPCGTYPSILFQSLYALRHCEFYIVKRDVWMKSAMSLDCLPVVSRQAFIYLFFIN